ncbi:MAG: hypothetical protein ABIH19_01820 [Candidatus Omnitrophota bacterium]
MKRLIKINLTIMILGFILISSSFAQDTLTITTYYPSPQGVYRVLKLHPGSRPGSCNEGEMYYDDGGLFPAGLYFCDSSSSWKAFGGLWAESGNNIFNTNIGNVGIGVTNANAMLQIGTANADITQVGTIRFNQGTGTTIDENFGARVTLPSNDNGHRFVVVNSDGSTILSTKSDRQTGINTDQPGSALSIFGNLSVGGAYSGDSTPAPADGVIIQGDVGIGTTAPAAKLEVDNMIRFTPRAGAPATWASGIPGRLAYSSSDAEFYYDNGSAWVAQGGGGGMPTCTRYSTGGVIGPSGAIQLSYACPSGQLMTGGCYSNAFTGRIFASYPDTDNNRWYCHMFNTGAFNINYTIYVQCCQ